MSLPHNGSGHKVDRKHAFIFAERTQESSGNYEIVNPGSGALGAYQVMPSNLPGWLRESGLPQMTAYQYLHDPQAQDRLAWHILGGYYDHYGPAGAAAMWYSGQPDPTKTYGDPPVYVYVRQVLQHMKDAGWPVNYGPAPGGPPFNMPPPPKLDWSETIGHTAGRMHKGAAAIQSYATIIGHLRE